MTRRHDRAALAVGRAGCGRRARGPGAVRVVAGAAPRAGVRDRAADAGAVALTFDDGPHPRGTPATLAALERAGVRATFFLVGEQVRRDPALAAEILAAGHAGRPSTATVTATSCGWRRAQVREDLARAEAAIVSADRADAAPVPAALRRAHRGGARRTRAAAAGSRCCGRAGAATGARGPRRRASRRRRRPTCAAARWSSCTTPTTTRRPARGSARWRRCRCVVEEIDRAGLRRGVRHDGRPPSRRGLADRPAHELDRPPRRLCGLRDHGPRRAAARRRRAHHALRRRARRRGDQRTAPGPARPSAADRPGELSRPGHRRHPRLPAGLADRLGDRTLGRAVAARAPRALAARDAREPRARRALVRPPRPRRRLPRAPHAGRALLHLDPGRRAGSPIGPYTLLTLAGSAIWCFGFAAAGWALGSSYESASTTPSATSTCWPSPPWWRRWPRCSSTGAGACAGDGPGRTRRGRRDAGGRGGDGLRIAPGGTAHRASRSTPAAAGTARRRATVGVGLRVVASRSLPAPVQLPGLAARRRHGPRRRRPRHGRQLGGRHRARGARDGAARGRAARGGPRRRRRRAGVERLCLRRRQAGGPTDAITQVTPSGRSRPPGICRSRCPTRPR